MEHLSNEAHIIALETLRKEDGTVQISVALAAGHNQSWYARVIKGKLQIGINELMLILDFYCVNPSDFYKALESVKEHKIGSIRWKAGFLLSLKGEKL